nr:YHS domain-containing (seleno)protein [Candidatus Synechococcus calcipolaris]
MNVKYLATLFLTSLLTVGLGDSLSASTPTPASDTSQTVAQSVATTRHPAVYTENGIALDGQDVVAYFVQNALVEGKQEFSYTWNGVRWLFSNAAHRDLFAQNPEQYAPQYGGYCAKAAAGGVLATTVPTAWEVRDGKLYLNYSAQAQNEWRQDTATKIVKANANWPKILNNDVIKR